MEPVTPAPARESPPAYTPVASWRHLASFFVILGLVVAASSLGLNHVGGDGGSSPRHAAQTYIVLIAIEWAQVVFVWYGIRERGLVLADLIGGRWDRVRDVLKDVLLGLACWLASGVAGGLLLWALNNGRGMPENVKAMLPQSRLELCLWLVVAASAGICEEIVFRGYLQRQLAAVGGRLGWGILGQAIVFGIGHSYQGLESAVGISVLALAMGAVAAWRKSLRPTMIWHVWMDAIGGVAMYLIR